MGRLNESVDVQDFPPEALTAQVDLLDNPWIGDEGPLDAGVRHGRREHPLRPRGLAFDHCTTVVWDEAGVQVLAAAPPAPDVTAWQCPVLLRDTTGGPPQLSRVDYLKRGSLLGSRYVPEGDPGHA